MDCTAGISFFRRAKAISIPDSANPCNSDKQFSVGTTSAPRYVSAGKKYANCSQLADIVHWRGLGWTQKDPFHGPCVILFRWQVSKVSQNGYKGNWRAQLRELSQLLLEQRDELKQNG